MTPTTNLYRMAGPAMHAVCSAAAWWIAELGGMVPLKLRSRFKPGRDWLIVDANDQACSANGADKPTRSGAHDPNLLPQEDRGRVPAAAVAIRLPRHAVLQRQVVLPGAAKGELARILRYEVERITPLTAENSAYDYRLVSTDRKTGELTVQLVITEKKYVDDCLAAARHAGLEPRYLGPALPDGTFPSPFNLLPDHPHRQSSRSRSVAWAGLACCALVCGIATIVSTLSMLDAQISILNDKISQIQPLAREGSTLREEIAERDKQTTLLAHYRAIPSPLETLAEVTARLPDDTWLNNLRMKRDGVQLKGYSADASRLVGILSEAPPFSDVRFTSPVTRERGSQLEQFNIELKLGGWGGR